MTKRPKSPARECPRWDHCSVNACPLDPYPRIAGDRETHCPMEKGVRVRIGSKYPEILPRGGLTPKESSGTQNKAKMTVAEKLALAAKGRAALAALRAKPVRNSAEDGKIPPLWP